MLRRDVAARAVRRRGEHEPRADRPEAGALGLDPAPVAGAQLRRAHRPAHARSRWKRRAACTCRASPTAPRGKSMGEHCEEMAQAVEDRARRPGPHRARLAPARGGGDGRGLLRRPRDPGRGHGEGRRSARRQLGREARHAEARVRPRERAGHASPRATPRRSPTAPRRSGWRATRASRACPRTGRARSSSTGRSPRWTSSTKGLLMAPAYAIPRLLARHGLTLDAIDLWEIHEAFAAQVLCNVAALESEDFLREKVRIDARLGKLPVGALQSERRQRRDRPPVRRHGRAHPLAGGEGARGDGPGQARDRVDLRRRRGGHGGAAGKRIAFLVARVLGCAGAAERHNARAPITGRGALVPRRFTRGPRR